MGLDVRLPVGLLFSAIGVALVAYGATSDPAVYAKSLDVNVNVAWGAVLLAFGLVMLWLGTRAPSPRNRAHQGKKAGRAGTKAEEPLAR